VSLFAQAASESPARTGAWGLDALSGRFIELRGAAGAAALTLSARLLWQAQQRGEPVVWLGHPESIFFPPDFAAAGIDLAALPVLRCSQACDLARAADTLLRSGAFAVLVLDLGERMFLSTAVQARLAGLAKRHQTVLIGITRRQGARSTLGPLVSLRGETSVRRTEFDRFQCRLEVVKDKQAGPGWQHEELCRGPDGLC